MATILSLADYKAAKGITSTDYDVQFSALLPMINGYIEAYCNRVFGEGEYTEKKEGIVNHMGDYVFSVQQKPIISVQSVTLKFRGAASTLAVDTTRLDIFENGGYMYYADELTPDNVVLRDEYKNNFQYTIVYSGGEAVPPAVQFAAVTMLSDTYEYYNRTNTSLASGTQQVGELSGIKIGDYAEYYATGDNLFRSMHGSHGSKEGAGVVLTKTVRDLLEPYRAQGQSW